MPQVPGVPQNQSAQSALPAMEELPPTLAARAIGPIAALLVLGALGLWLFLRAPHPAPATPAAVSGAASGPASASPGGAPSPQGPVVVATLDELAAPWSSKAFTFHKRLTDEAVAALAVRLPGQAGSAASYWAFSLEEPFGKCQLEFVTDLSKISSQYGYQARHPLVADPCNNTLYDPLRLGNLPSGAWARGAVIQGLGIRPPIAIELRLQGNQLVATQIE